MLGADLESKHSELCITLTLKIHIIPLVRKINWVSRVTDCSHILTLFSQLIHAAVMNFKIGYFAVAIMGRSKDWALGCVVHPPKFAPFPIAFIAGLLH